MLFSLRYQIKDPNKLVVIIIVIVSIRAFICFLGGRKLIIAAVTTINSTLSIKYQIIPKTIIPKTSAR